MSELEKVTEITEKKELSLDDINVLSQVVTMEAQKNSLEIEAKAICSKQNEMMGLVSGLDSDKDFINEKLDKYTIKELESYLKSDVNVMNFFKNETTGEVLEIAVPFETKERELEFRRGLLTYLKTSRETLNKIDEEFERYDAETKEFNKGIQDVCKDLSDNILTYLSYMKDKAEAMTDEGLKKKFLEELRYIHSGYTMEIFSETLDKYPSIVEKCKTELTKEGIISRVGMRYLNKLKTNNIRTSLIPYTSDITSGKKSLEEQILIAGDQYTIPDLFVYSLIRYFSMEDLSDTKVRKLHATVSIVLKRLVANAFDETVKADVINAIVAYIKKFD